MSIDEILGSIIGIFIMIIPGVIFRKIGVLSEDRITGLSAMVLNLLLPCLIVDSMQISFSKEILNSCYSIISVLVGGLLTAVIMALILTKPLKILKNQTGVFYVSLMFSNAGLIGIPVISTIWGKEAVFYGAVFEALIDACIFTIGVLILQLYAGRKFHVTPKNLITPGLIGVIIGVILFVTGLTLPSIIGTPISTIGAATSPVAMLTLGGMLGGIKIKDFFCDVKIYAIAAGRLMIIPLLLWLFFVFIMEDRTLVIRVMIMIHAMPTALLCAILPGQYGGDSSFAAKGAMMSTLLCVFTLPLWVVILV